MKGPAFQISAKSAGGGGSGCAYQQAILPPSSVFNSPKAWTKDTSMVFPAGYDVADSIQLVHGDNIYVIGNGKIKVGNLRTKVWEAGDVATNIGPPACACFYDDYKIFIVERIMAFNDGTHTIKTVSFNTSDKSISPLTQFTNNDSMNYYENPVFNGPGNFMPIIFISENRQIVFGYSYYQRTDTGNSGYEYYSGGTRRSVYLYNIDTNSISKVVSFDNFQGSVGQNAPIDERRMFKNAIISAQNGIVRISNSIGAPNKCTSVTIGNGTVNESTTSINFSATAWTDFNGQKLMVNNTSPTLYNNITDQQSSVVVPNLLETPPFASLNTWDNQIIFLTASGLHKLPYVAQEPTDKMPVWGFVKGQRFCGTKELPIINKPTITTQWQTAQTDFEICLGEYDSAGEYRILVSSGAAIGV